jgi:hypothetical protein
MLTISHEPSVAVHHDRVLGDNNAHGCFILEQRPASVWVSLQNGAKRCAPAEVEGGGKWSVGPLEH